MQSVQAGEYESESSLCILESQSVLFSLCISQQ